VADIGPQEPRRFERVMDQLRRFWDDAMRMHVNGRDPLATQNNLAAPLRLCLARAATRPGTGVCADGTADKGEARARLHGLADRHGHSSRASDRCHWVRVVSTIPASTGWRGQTYAMAMVEVLCGQCDA